MTSCQKVLYAGEERWQNCCRGNLGYLQVKRRMEARQVYQQALLV